MNKLALQQAAALNQQNDAQLVSWMASLRSLNISQQDDQLANLVLPLLQASGWQGEARSLHDVLPAMRETLVLDDLLTMMSALGYRISCENKALKDIKADQMPALFVPQFETSNHPIMLLLGINAEGLQVDRGRGAGKYGRAYTTSRLRGALYRFEREDAHRTDASAATMNTPWLRAVAQRLRPLLWQAALLSLAMHIFSLAMPLFSMGVYDRVIAAQAPGTLPLLVVGVLGAFITEAILRAIRSRLIGWISGRAELIICHSMFERLLFLPAALIEQASVSSQLARIRAFEAVRDFISGPMFLIALELPFIFVLIFAMSFFAGPVAIVPVVMVAAYTLLLMLFRTHWQKLGFDLAHSAAARQQLLMEIVDNAKPIYAAGIGERLMQRFRHVSWQAASLQHRYGMTTTILQYIASFMTVAAAIITINWCLARIWAGEMSGGAMVASMIISWRLLYPLQALCNIVPNYEQVRASVRQVAQLMSLPPETHAWRYALGKRALQGKVEFQNIGLRYNRKTDPVFLGLNAMIQKGEIVAVYGGNGCGKSSVLRLLLGLYAPAMGTIRIDGIDHRQLDPRTLRRHIAYLPQQPEFLPGTVADNLRLASPLAADYQLRQALLWADALDMVEELPQGLHTPITDNTALSGGLAARLLLARLYLSEQPIVLCDELPGQLLNSTTGDRFRKFLEECRGKRTVFFVTHREDWLNIADQVIWLKPEAMPVVGRPGNKSKVKVEPDLAQIDAAALEAEDVSDEQDAALADEIKGKDIT